MQMGPNTWIKIEIDQGYERYGPSGPSGVIARKVIDFDAQHSIVNAGSPTNPNYQFKPTIRATPRNITGSITGSVSNPTNAPIAYAIANGDTITSTRIESNGHFRLGFLPEGTYNVTIRNTTGQSYDSPSIGLIPKQDADLGTISLQ